jgi:hypothetical protein
MSPSELLKEIEKLVNDALSIQEGRRDRFRLRRWNSVKRTAERLELTGAHVRTLLKEGKLVGKKGSGAGAQGKWYVSRESILAFESGGTGT